MLVASRAGWGPSWAPGSLCGLKAAPQLLFLLTLSFLVAAHRGVVSATDAEEGLQTDRRVYSEEQKARAAADQKAVMDSGAVPLSEASYSEFMAAHPLALVMFYAPWCYWSRSALPELDAAAKLLSHHSPPVVGAKVDCTDNEDLCNQEYIREYPTIRLYVEGVGHLYEGRRYGKGNLEDGHVVVVAAFPPDYNRGGFQSVARAFGEEVLFGDTSDPELTTRLVDKHVLPRLPKKERNNSEMSRQLKPPFVVVFAPHKDEPGVHIYKGPVGEVKELRSFVRQWLFPVVSLFDSDSIGSSFFSDSRPKFLLLLDSNKQKGQLKEVGSAKPKDPLLAAFRAVAEKHRISVAAAVSGNSKNFEKQLLNLLGIEDETLPQVRIMQVSRNQEGPQQPAKKFRPSSPLPPADEGKKALEDMMDAFVSGVLAQTLPPYFRSETPPDTPEPKGRVRTLVASTFATEVRKEANVLVEFYAPWCGFCRKMEPAYKELAMRVAGVSGLLIARIDATRNEVEGVAIAGYPTLYLYRRGEKEPLLYAGDRSTRDMLKWLSLRVRGTSPFDVEELMSMDIANPDKAAASVLEEL
ncbi:LOW QUALITY PROTEIN: thioredoxin, putative [Eimeria mitis]|uniref:protein disulfide-isomerase n=1 Tax=Eimeria mitis TaxID=44415 RepID=U6KFU8_9EIME|nr:LOW QUALITY PROTEIN: thioredoxin, putative [Eimeria mitis]CDJ35666.1 thioredoxin, putative [Eimeria mitis]